MNEPPPLPTRRQLAVLSVILLAAAFLRFDQICAPSLWMDEIWSIEMAMGRGSVHDHPPIGIVRADPLRFTDLSTAAPWPQIWTHLDGYPHPPLYLILLRWWMDAFGNSPRVVRSLSAVFSIAAIPVLFDIARLLGPSRIAFLAAAIMTLAIAQIDFAQDARNYSLLIFLCLAACDALVRIESFGARSGPLLALALLSTAAFLTHYFAAGAIAAMGIYSLARFRGHARFEVLGAMAVAMVLFLAFWGWWMPRQIASLPSVHPPYLYEPAQGHVRMTLFRLIGLPGRYLLGDSLSAQMPAAVLLIAAVLGYLPLILRIVGRRQSLLWVLWILGTIGAVAATDLVRGSILLDYLRYTLTASPVIYIIFAGIDWPNRPVFRDAVPLLVLALLAIFAAQRAINPVESKEDWRRLTQDLDQAAGPHDLLVFYGDDPWISPGTWSMALEYYRPGEHRPWLVLHRRAGRDLVNKLRPMKSIWLIGKFPRDEGTRILPDWHPAGPEERTSAGAFCLMEPN